jgi:cell wall-associated NlpC family hydrolase
MKKLTPKFIAPEIRVRRLLRLRQARLRKIQGMRCPTKFPLAPRLDAVRSEKSHIRSDFIKRVVVASLLSFAVAAANAADTDSISPASLVAPPAPPPTALERIEKNLRDLGQRARDSASEISKTALGLIGVEYKFGGNTPDTGLDCSGFVRYVFQQATGISLPRSSREQAKVGKQIDKNQLEPGDLVFFNTRRFQFSHVGVYLGDNRFIHSPSRGGSVEVVNLDNKYWQKTFNGARRIIGAVAGSEANAATLREAAKIEADLRSQRDKLMRSAVAESTAKPAASAASATPSAFTNSSPFTRDY